MKNSHSPSFVSPSRVAEIFDGESDQKRVYRDIRNFLAGRVVGATRDEALLDEVVKCLLCKAFLVNGNTPGEAHLALAYRDAFDRLRDELHGFDPGEPIRLDDEAIEFVDSRLAQLDLSTPTRDPLGDLYETFVGSAMRGQEGQFFTPQNAIELLVSIVDPKPGETVLDPASGAGGFLSSAARHLIGNGADRNDVAKWLYGVEKDAYLASLAQRHVVVAAAAPAHIVCGDSLAWLDQYGKPLTLPEGDYDVILTNPPFGTRIVAASEALRAKFASAYRWKLSNRGYVPTKELLRSVPPQVLFLERCLQLVRPGGRVGMVVPESLLSNANYGYVRHILLDVASVEAVVGMPESLFKTSGKGGTHTKTCLLVFRRGKSETRPIFMAEARWCGHDSRGNRIPHDDLPRIASAFHCAERPEEEGAEWLGFYKEELTNGILSPRYYDPQVDRDLHALRETHDLLVFGELADADRVDVATGDEVGKLEYLRGDGVPFVRTSDISTWEIKVDPKHRVDVKTFDRLKKKQDVRENDLLMVKDGTYLIGTCAMVTRHDTRIVYQSHLYKIRVRENDPVLNPWLLLAVLSSPVVRRQIKAKSFTQDIIDSLGKRINELVLPIPRREAARERITEMVKHAIDNRVAARELGRAAALEVAAPPLVVTSVS